MPEDTSLDQFVGNSEEREPTGERPSEEASGEERPASSEARESKDERASKEASGEAASSEEREPTGERSDGDASTAETEKPPTENAAATYDWTPDGAACECCDESAERRWRDDERMVCANCKEW